MLALSSVIITLLKRSSKTRTRSTTRPNLVEVESTSEPVAEINNAGVIIAVKNSIVELSSFGFTLNVCSSIKLDADKRRQQKSLAKQFTVDS